MLKKDNTKEEKPKAEDECKKQIDDLTNKWKRALADYQNLEKRIIQERQATRNYEVARIMQKILSAVDNLESAERHLKDQGLTLAVKNLSDIVSSEGIKKIEVIGKQFDPLKMECVEMVEGDKDDVVTAELRPGYESDGKIIRVAQVKVSKKKVKENINIKS